MKFLWILPFVARGKSNQPTNEKNFLLLIAIQIFKDGSQVPSKVKYSQVFSHGLISRSSIIPLVLCSFLGLSFPSQNETLQIEEYFCSKESRTLWEHHPLDVDTMLVLIQPIIMLALHVATSHCWLKCRLHLAKTLGLFQLHWCQVRLSQCWPCVAELFLTYCFSTVSVLFWNMFKSFYVWVCSARYKLFVQFWVTCTVDKYVFFLLIQIFIKCYMGRLKHWVLWGWQDNFSNLTAFKKH